MGNACFSNTSYCFKNHFDICVDNNLSNIKVSSISIDEEEKNISKINKLKKYFAQNEKEISEDFYGKNLKISAKKKRNSGYFDLLLIDKTKYETMLKNLLEQKNIERKGPKRRKTIRNEEQINSLINEVLNENKNNINNNKYKRVNSKRRNSIIIKNKDTKKRRQSTTLKREELPNHNNSSNNFFKAQMIKVNTLNEILTDGNKSTVFNKRETYKV